MNKFRNASENSSGFFFPKQTVLVFLVYLKNLEMVYLCEEHPLLTCFLPCSCRPLQTKQRRVPQGSRLHTAGSECLLQMPERIQRRWLYVPSNKSLRRRVQWRLPRACHLHCHRTCKLNDFRHQQGILRHFCLVPAEILPLAGSHSLPLTAPVFQNNLYIAPACFPHQFGILSAEG